MKMKMFADGGSRGNPGPAASGYVLMTPEDKILKREGVFLGIATNNQAEYTSLRLGLEQALKMGATEIDVYMDSQLVVNQMKGLYKIKNPGLIEIYRMVNKVVEDFDKVTFTHVFREFNKLADAEVNLALDRQ
jgi:ribonuclease HI